MVSILIIIVGISEELFCLGYTDRYNTERTKCTEGKEMKDIIQCDGAEERPQNYIKMSEWFRKVGMLFGDNLLRSR